MVEPTANISSVGGFVLQVGNWLAAPIWRQFKYLYKYNTNFEYLQEEVEKLKNTRDQVQHKVNDAERNVEGIKPNVKKWQKDVDSIIGKAEQLNQEKANNPRCFKGLCPNLVTRYRHSKKAFKLKENDISQLLDKEFNEVSYPTNPQEIWLRSNEDYLAFESRNSTVKDLWDALNDENISMIGVYGMGGLGKTTLVQEIGRKAEKDKLFDEIVFVEITETLDVKKVQTEIADKLGVKFSNESERANKLYERLKSNKKILLILDNIWKDLHLKTIGIPSKMDRGGCKLLLTTRNLDVLQKMDSTSNFGMSILKDEEAWNLFMKMAGGVIQTRGLNSLPQDVCKECGGLPIVICAIAKALRNKSRSSDWKVVLRELKAPSLTKFGGLLEEEYQKIALSYKYLRNDELRKTFLISSLMGNDTSILDLFKHVVGLDILEGANLTIEEARDSLDKLVYELKDSCLLLEGSRSKQFSMHDVIRVVAMTIAYTDHHVFTVRNDIEKEWKDKDKLRKCTKIYLPGDNVIRQLWHEELDFPNLDFFYMDMNNSIKIHENLFKEMPKLKALNLFRMELPLLPVSLGRLINLQTLCLDYSKIEDFAIIGELKKLKVFSLQSCLCIKELPREISQLTQLRLLDLSNCRKLKVVAPNIISKLSQLEELYTKGCFIQWTVQVLGELKSLSRLTSLELDMNENKILPKGFFSKELKRYKISIGDWLPRYLRINKDESLRMLEFKFNSTISLEEFRGIKNVEILFLAIDVKNSLDELQSNITPIFNEKVAFPDLKVLALVDINFRKIWDSHLPTSYYQNLIHFILEKCRNIKYVFPSTICKSLQQLQCLEICDCKDLEEIVAKEEGIETTVNFVFPQVTLLTLKNLPKLVAFYPRKHTVEWPKLKELVLRNCDKISLKYLNFEENNEDGLHISESKSLFLNDKINPDLDEMILELKKKYINWHSQSKALEIRHDVSTNIPFELLHTFKNLKELDLCCNEYKELFFPNLPNLEVLHVISCCRLMSLVPSSASFQNLKVLRVDRCNGLMKLITPSTVKSLMQLREMRVENCMVLKEIVGKEEGANAVFNFVFPNVTLLQLENLPELTTFYPERHTSEWPKLKVLRLRYCVKLSSKHLSFKENNEESELNISDSKSIYLEDKINQDLEVFELNNHDAYICWDSRSKALKIIGDKPTNVPLGLLHNGEYKELFFPIPNFEALDGTMDSSRLVDVKQRIADDGDKVKSWKIPDVSEPSQIKALRLPDSIAPSKVVRLIYTNSGVALLALTASAVHKLWKWQRSERNPLGKATVHVAPQLWQPLSGTLMTNDVTDGEPAEESAACIALSKNDGYVISASGGEVSLFNIYTFKVMKTFMPPPPAATYLAFHPQDNNIIAIGMEDSTIQIYNVRVNKVITKLKGHQNRITGLAFSRVLNALLSSGADGQLCMWSIDKWEKLKSRFIQAPAGRQSPLVGETKVQFHDDQRHLLVVHDSQISIYDSKLECSRSWSPKDSLPAPISSAIYSCYSLLVYAGFCDGAVGVFDASDLRLRCRIAASAYIPSFAVSNTTTYPFVISAHPSEPNQIALGMSDGAVHVVELSDAELKWGGTPSQDNSSLLIR